MELEEEHLRPLAVMVQLFLDRQLIQHHHSLQKAAIAHFHRIEELSQKQRSLKEQAIAIAQRQKQIDIRRESERTKLRRLQQNERFTRWLDNTCWAISRLGKGSALGVGRWLHWALAEIEWKSGSTRVLVGVVLFHWLVLFPLVGLIGLRFVLSDRCFRGEPCKSFVLWSIDEGSPEFQKRP